MLSRQELGISYDFGCRQIVGKVKDKEWAAHFDTDETTLKLRFHRGVNKGKKIEDCPEVIDMIEKKRPPVDYFASIACETLYDETAFFKRFADIEALGKQ